MPSAQYKEIDQPAGMAPDNRRGELQSLLRTIGASKINGFSSLHPRGRVLFNEGEPARGVYILRSGRATVSISSSEGRVVMLRLAQPGDVLGVNSVLQDSTYDTTVKTLESCRTEFVSRSEFIERVKQHHGGAEAMLTILSLELAQLTERAKSLLLPQTVRGRLAKLLLELSNGANSDGSQTAQLDGRFTHEEIAQMICSSRETVTRLLASLGRQNVIRITSGTIAIVDRPALEKIALT
jgi:CRP/FNR family transcriptional regulator, cyclic AMP receptor protein